MMGSRNGFWKWKHLIVLGLFFLPELLTAYLVDTNPFHHVETLDRDGKYLLEWLVDWEESRVIFNVTVRTKGYVGFGLSRKGKMSGADIVIGGVLQNGEPYLSDRHAIGNQLPVEDESQDWVLHAARESDTETFLSFSRPFETCDEDHDLVIHDDVIALLWAFGENDDEIEYHHQNRGVFYAYLLDPDLAPRELKETEQYGLGGGGTFLGDWKVWSIAHSRVIPTKDTTYMCSIHKSPVARKNHIVGYRSILPTEVERRHIHHFLVHRCIPPVGQDASRIFQPLVGYEEECYILSMPAGDIPTNYCTEVVQVWAVGQRPNFFPDHVGIPMDPNEYFMIQMHYDNPDLIPGIRVTHALEVFHTENLRKHDAAMLTLGELTPASPSIIVPPNSLAHEIYGHCGSGCTKSRLPPTGIRAFASNLHTHLAGRGVRLRHIRDNKELPWISYDDNYNFNYQQIRQLREERLILQDDILMNRCIFENTDRNGNVTVGGFSTRNEMCSGFIWYYDKIPNLGVCRSEIRSDVYKRFVQIYNTTWSNPRLEMVVTSPSQNAGLLVSEVGNTRLNWTLANRAQLQDHHRYLPQISMCPSLFITEDRNLDEGSGKPSWLSASTSSRLTTPKPHLLPQRFAAPPPIRRVSISSGTFKRPPSSATDGLNTRNSEIRDPEIEFVSINPRDMELYERPSVCGPRHTKRSVT